MIKTFNIFEILTPKSQTFFIEDNSTIRQALETFAYHKFSVVPLINKEGKYVTTISEGDILRYIAFSCEFDKKKSESTKISSLEKYRSYKAININVSFEEIFDMALSQNFIPVVDDMGSFIGIIKRKDIFVYLKNNHPIEK